MFFFNSEFQLPLGHPRNWGARYLRSPEIFNKIIVAAQNKLIYLNNVVEVRRGFTTGANEFFYVIDHTEKIADLAEEEYRLTFGVKREKHKIDWTTYGWFFSDMTQQHYLLEKRFFKPLFKTQKEANKLDVDTKNLKYYVLLCNETKVNLRKYKYKLLSYIDDAENKDIHKRPSCMSRVSLDSKREWFHLESGNALFVGDLIFPSKIGEYYRLIDNRKAKIYCDKVNYNVKVREKYVKLSDVVFLVLNSITFRFFVDLFSRQLTGSQTLSDVDVNVVEKTLIINPELLLNREVELKTIYTSLKNREQGTIYEEVRQKDKKQLDTIIFEALGLSAQDVDELYYEACKYVKSRSEKSDSIITTKKKQKLDYDSSLRLIRDRFSEIRLYKDLLNGIPTKQFIIPNLKAKFPKITRSGAGNLFNHYDVYFIHDNSKQTTVRFDLIEQLTLFQYLHETFDMKGITLFLPQSDQDCRRILFNLKNDFDKYGGQIQIVLKTFRSKANYLSIYRDILFSSHGFSEKEK